MAAIHKKHQRLKPLIRIRQTQFDQTLMALQSIQKEVEKANLDLLKYQTMYIQGVDRLNKERQSSERNMLDALEKSIDFAKQQWYQSLSILRKLQEEERLHLEASKEAQLRLKMLEKIEEKYGDNILDYEKKLEQKQLDEFSTQSNLRKSRV